MSRLDDLLPLSLCPITLGLGYLVYRVAKSFMRNYGAEQEAQRMAKPGPLGMTAFEGLPLHAVDPAWNAAPIASWKDLEYSELFRGTVEGVELVAGTACGRGEGRASFPRRFVFARLPAEVPFFTIRRRAGVAAVEEDSFAVGNPFGSPSWAIGGNDADRVSDFLNADRVASIMALHTRHMDLEVGDGWMSVSAAVDSAEEMVRLAVALARLFGAGA